jgi:hypothetical protein
VERGVGHGAGNAINLEEVEEQIKLADVGKILVENLHKIVNGLHVSCTQQHSKKMK